MRWWLLGLVLAGTAWIAVAAAPPTRLPARFTSERCTPVAVVDATTRAPLYGIEDIAMLPDAASLLLSSHDRFDPSAPPGGLYRVAIAAIFAGGRVAADRLAIPVRRPHGIAVDPDSARLAVIERDDGGGISIWSIGDSVPVLGWRSTDKAFCRANDVAFAGKAVLATIDRASCGWSLRDLLPWSRKGRVLRVSASRAEIEISGLAFPNGVAAGAVAETRADRIRLTDGRHIDLPGGPDNLTDAPDRGIIAALHPRLLRLAFVRWGLLDDAPSRVVRIEPDGGRVEVLFDDPAGRIISGATVALQTKRGLVIGSAHDGGLVVCR